MKSKAKKGNKSPLFLSLSFSLLHPPWFSFWVSLTSHEGLEPSSFSHAHDVGVNWNFLPEFKARYLDIQTLTSSLSLLEKQARKQSLQVAWMHVRTSFPRGTYLNIKKKRSTVISSRVVTTKTKSWLTIFLLYLVACNCQMTFRSCRRLSNFACTWRGTRNGLTRRCRKSSN